MTLDKIKPFTTRIAGALITAIFTLYAIVFLISGRLMDLRKALPGEILLVIFFLAFLYNIHPYLARLFNRKNTLFKRPLFQKIIEFLTVATITLILHFLMFSIPFNLLYPHIQVPEQRIRISYFTTIAVSLIYYYYFERERAQLETRQSIIQSEKMSKENTEAQLLAFKQQISPHFLFNSLNVLNNLIEVDDEKAGEFLDQLTSIYHVFLENADNSLVSLQKDLELAEAYIGLLKTRFSRNLKFELNIEEAYKEYQVPPGILQMLIENAIKHNGFSKSHPLTLKLFTDSTNKSIVVKNNIQARKESVTSTGVGLKNIINRYAILTDRVVDIKKNDQEFIVILPLLNP